MAVGWTITAENRVKNLTLPPKIVPYNVSDLLKFNNLLSRGSSVVEQMPEEHRVGGSIPSLGTILRSYGASYGTAIFLNEKNLINKNEERSMPFEAYER